MKHRNLNSVKRVSLCLFISFLQFVVIAQKEPLEINHANKGIYFERELTWLEIKAKAKKENKYIFLDCYTTWCQPCKEMDDKIYSNENIGDYFNKEFISVKVQLDTNVIDNKSTVEWYGDAHFISLTYKPTAFPTYLFFSPNGNLVHRGIGALNGIPFVIMAANATNSDKQYYTLINRYKEGRIDYFDFPSLVASSKEFGENDLAIQISSDYMHNYLDKMNDSDFCMRENLDFIGSNYKIVTSKDRIFEWYLHRPEKIDSIMNVKRYSSGLLNYVINQEEIKPQISSARLLNTEPKWTVIYKRIASKYGTSLAKINIVETKVNWYLDKKVWKKYVKYLIIQNDLAGIQNMGNGYMSMVILNSSAWTVFQYSHSKRDLKKALLWIDKAIPMGVGSMRGATLDTKANILYKLGKIKEAVSIENQALFAAPNTSEFQMTLKNMKAGIPTWEN